MREVAVRLSPIACRVLGSLAEKRLTTPNQYPLTVAALQTACNQRSARDPVMELSETDVQQGLRELRDEGLARTSPVRGRVSKHEHTLDVQLDLRPPDQAVLGVLLLRGPQTVGEIRTRTDRWVEFAELEAVQAVLDRLAGHQFLPLVAELPREPGRRESRWTHLLGDPEPTPAAAPTAAPPAAPAAMAPTRAELAERVEQLEAQVQKLRDELATLHHKVAPIIEELG